MTEEREMVMSAKSTAKDRKRDKENQVQRAAEDAEVEQLRAQVADLQQQASERTGNKGRRWAVGLLIVLGCILAAVANPAVWARNVLLDTDGWTAMVAPMTHNKVVADAFSIYAVDNLFELVDAQQEIQQVLPEEIRLLSGPLTYYLQDLVTNTVSELIQSDEFNAVWVSANQIGHRAVVSVLRFDGRMINLQDGQLVVDLSAIFDSVQVLLGFEGADLFSNKDWGRYVLFESQQLAVIQQVVAVLDSLSLWLPLLTLGIFGVAWWTSLWRRRTLLWIGAGLAIAMVLTLISLAVARPLVLTSIANVLLRPVADEIWNMVLRGLFIQTILLLIAGLLIVLGAVLAGPRLWAVQIRTTVRERVRSWR
jgi:hypothetical protein